MADNYNTLEPGQFQQLLSEFAKVNTKINTHIQKIDKRMEMIEKQYDGLEKQTRQNRS